MAAAGSATEKGKSLLLSDLSLGGKQAGWVGPHF